MTTPDPPTAPKHPHRTTLHGRAREDEYAWLRDRERPEVMAHLEAENAYTECVMRRNTGSLRSRLYDEMKARIKEDDRTVPYRDGGYWYYSRIEPGQEYWVHCRRRGSMDADEEILLDENELGAVHEYVAVDGWAISPDHATLAYAVDTSGDEYYEVRFKDLRSGEMLPDRIEEVGASLAWANDGRTLFYDLLDEAQRPYKLLRHRVGTPTSEDVEVFREEDERFSIEVSRTKSEAFLVLSTSSQVTSEAWLLDADQPDAEPRLFAARRQDVEYDVAHHRDGEVDRFFILSNAGARNFAVFECPVDATEPEHWRVRIAHRDDVFLEDFDCFRDHLVIDEREDGSTRVRVVRLSDGHEHYVDFPDPAYAIYGDNNPDYASTTLRFGYSSLTTPPSIFDYGMNTAERVLLKRQEISGGWDSTGYACARIPCESHDGVSVPISLVWRGNLERDGERPLLLYGYGAYGSPTDAEFSRSRLSLLDRGVVFAIAHVRGGAEMGRRWYDDGKLAHKHNTFLDFIAAAEHLCREGYTSPDRLAGMGGSAGGLLIGAVANMRGDLFRALVADVPFVDVINTLLDPSLPLTVGEWEEWGNPEEAADYEILAAYSPYDNVAEQAYPDLLVTAGLNDPRVGYWEPAKWVARLRDRKTDDNLLLLHTHLDAGHGGPSGRYEYLEEVALEFAFVLDRLGVDADGA